jgi:predicted lipid carrier protein YhbT
MQAINTSIPPGPVLPKLLSLPARLTPSFVHNRALTTALNIIFYKNLKQGELDFLQDRIIRIEIDDIGIDFRISLAQKKIISADRNAHIDLELKGSTYNYMLLASRREDTDTLFFSRRLHMQGDTELGLYVKNFLDGMDMDSDKIPAYLEAILQKTLLLYERFFKA